jgi:drug/metabolite transporter (DMT)-like permease
VLGGVLFYRGVRSIPSGLASVLTYLEPLVATAIGSVVFHEPLGSTAAVGAALVLGGGVYLATEPARAA